jgi:hypothetical protein
LNTWALAAPSAENHLSRNVKGVLFLDYVRMLRKSQAAHWADVLEPEDIIYLVSRIESDGWYPMDSFERLGNAILRLWGRMSVDPLLTSSPNLLSPRDPLETLMRFRVYRSTFFDFEALNVTTLVDDHAEIVIAYGMGHMAEEAASYQTMGFFERLLELASATQIEARFKERSWAGDPRTLLALGWEPPSR